MKAYLLTSGVIFALIVVAHIARVVMDGVRVTRDPVFLISTILAAALTVWAARLLRSYRSTV